MAIGAYLIYLPPYSSDLNLMEEVFWQSKLGFGDTNISMLVQRTCLG